ncbi:uncharacterized protein GLRG_08940 [Colletotrichum graminicola M1.001]|uniref:CFEM domain-containing protein n=1 Tax=Colletotrichum graminicola (strain M1.001 / M2 / FGSC 10212) TaxID=645133 RepID=E3QSG9_COLGM|nr:uncharacterized protein GLRG_08940 [Colletotrichum graminicola M1.001]EFQ33796.1 hypothetical protein GLRG_08940 [Colletotrichum graminicola M1.001]
MLVGAFEKIWINEPVPLPNHTISSCYPTEWLDGYASVISSSSSVAPYMSPLVCPDGWNTETSTWTDGYIACCASGFTFAGPSSAIDTDRPAYGGTCYSNFELGKTATVTVYNNHMLSTTIAWAASTTPAQAYAHPIDGIAADYTPTATRSKTSTKTGAGAAQTGVNAASQRGGNSRAAFMVGFLLASLVAW